MIKLREIIEHLRSDRDEDVYIRKSDSKLIVIDDETALDNEDFFTDLQINNDNYLYLSKSCGIDIRTCMIDFVDILDNDHIKHELGKYYTYPIFRDTLFHFGLRDAWNEYMNYQYYMFVCDFFKQHNIEYIDNAMGKHEFVIKVQKTYVKEYSIYAKTKEEALSIIEKMDEDDALGLEESDLLEGVFDVVGEND